MQFTYCPDCGGKLTAKRIGDEGDIPYCEVCRRPWFPYSTPAVICAVHDGNGRIALIEQSYGEKRFVCVAGFVKAGESMETCVMREIAEEIGQEAVQIRFVRSYFYEKRDQLMLGFAVQVQRSAFRLSGEVRHAEWFTPAQALERLQNAKIARQLVTDALDAGYISET
ncbi:MAG: NUDIX domain-containing protein [Oscillospiraceae bacterium]|nr:NUDIX domain-containing protein [Oscillospiraceae bacterium]